jgi:antitoxin (DNA-binding transcriptional repressor) of toxin-antitoxin stability system
MGVMSIREFNANTSAAFAKVEAGERLEITKDGRVIAEIRPKKANKMDDPEFRAKREALLNSLKNQPLGLSGPATYDERTSR